MRNGRRIVDFHVHVFDEIKGKSVGGLTRGLDDGKIVTGDIVSQFMPACYKDTSFPIDVCIERMDAVGVDQALLIQNPTIGDKNGYIDEAVRLHEDRLLGSIQVDMFDPGAADTIAKYARNPLTRVLKLEISEEYGWTGMYPQLRVCDSPEMQPVWDAVNREKLAIVYDIGGVGHRAWQLDQFAKLSDKMPDTPVLIEHFGGMNSTLYGVPWAMNRFDELIGLAKRDNVFLGITGVSLGLRQPDGGYQLAWEALKRAFNVVGSEKLIWGSDIPGTLRIQTYEQMIEWVEQAPFMSETDKDHIFALNSQVFLNALQ